MKTNAVDPEARQASGQFISQFMLGKTTAKRNVACQETQALAASIHKVAVANSNKAAAASGWIIQP